MPGVGLLFRSLFVLALLAGLVPSAVHGQGQAPASSAEARQQELTAAIQAAVKAGTRGPADVPLLDQATLHLPEDMLFVPPEEGARLLRAWGNRVPANPVGLVLGTKQNDDWAEVVRYVKAGYIKDDDARDWNADQLLASIRDSTEESNKDRVSRGFQELEIIG